MGERRKRRRWYLDTLGPLYVALRCRLGRAILPSDMRLRLIVTFNRETGPPLADRNSAGAGLFYSDQREVVMGELKALFEGLVHLVVEMVEMVQAMKR